MIKAILFDWGGVLTIGMHDLEIVKILESENKVKMFSHEPDFGSFLDLMDLSEVTFGEFVEKVNNEFGLSLSDEQMRDVVARALIPNKDVIDLVRMLSEKYHVVILTNNSHTTIEILREQHKETIDLFEKLYYSADLGICKPDKEIFEFVAKDLGVSLSECVFIDDKEKYAIGAEKAGMKGIVFKNAAQLKKDLESIGVTI
ncbi:HAD family hydrolase [Thermoproteota archaeon]